MRRAPVISALVSLSMALLPALPAAATSPPSLSWQLTPTGTTAQLRGFSAVSHEIAWASGRFGTVLRTTDGGASWRQVGPPDTSGLDFRDIEAFDADNAVALSIGEGTQSRIYRTTDGGAHWTEAFRNPDKAAFYDCLAFFDRKRGLALSDPVDGKFRLLSTSDGGGSWTLLPNDGMPAALTGEFAFAASGQCIRITGHEAWIASGGGAAARVYHSHDRGLHWTVSTTPLTSNGSSGVFAIDFRDPHRGIAVGGDFRAPANGSHALARTRDGGRTWTEPSTAPAGYRSGIAFHPFFSTVAIAVGPTGSDITLDAGQHWHQFDTGTFDTVTCTHDGSCWASGEQGRVGILKLG
jgi:photosystem II stability/assembly factor-like uncharacterized protein